VVAAIIEEYAVPNRLPVMQHVQDVLLAVGIDAKDLYLTPLHDQHRVDGVTFVYEYGALGVGGLYGA